MAPACSRAARRCVISETGKAAWLQAGGHRWPGDCSCLQLPVPSHRPAPLGSVELSGGHCLFTESESSGQNGRTSFFFLIAIWLLYNVVLVLLDNEVNRLCVYICAVLNCFSHVRLFVTLWTVARQAPRFMDFSRQEYWGGLSFPSPGDLPTQGSNLRLLHFLH